VLWLGAGCAGGGRARGNVRTGMPDQDDYFRRVQALLSRVERAEAAASAELRDPPAGVRVRIDGEGPGAQVSVMGSAAPEVLLRTQALAADLAAAPVQMDAAPAEADALLVDSQRLSRMAMILPGVKGHRLRAAHAEATALLRQLPDRARLAARAARALLAQLRD
jgi:hypothetical protein